LHRGGEAAQELRLKASNAGLMARKSDVAAANALLDEVEATLGNMPPTPSNKGKDQATGEQTDNRLRLRERVLVVNAHDAYEEYLDVRDSADDPVVIVSALQHAETVLRTWTEEIGTQGDPNERERMALLARRLEFERGTLDDAQQQLTRVEALIQAAESESDPGRRSVLTKAIREALNAIVT
jgi:ATP/maltotriose-dependent transcriptional regulator MalT